MHSLFQSYPGWMDKDTLALDLAKLAEVKTTRHSSQLIKFIWLELIYLPFKILHALTENAPQKSCENVVFVSRLHVIRIR